MVFNLITGCLNLAMGIIFTLPTKCFDLKWAIWNYVFAILNFICYMGW